MIKNKKLSYLLWASVIVIFLIFLFIGYKDEKKVKVSYNNELYLETMIPIKLCIKENDEYKMINYYVSDYKHIINMYLGKGKLINEKHYIPDNNIVNVKNVWVSNDEIVIETTNNYDCFNSEAFKMMKVTLSYLGFKKILIENGNVFTL